MKTYLVGYDLNRPRGEDDYQQLTDALKTSFDNWWHHLDSTWIIKTNLSAVEIRDSLTRYIDSGDELLVVQLSGEGAWTGFNTNGSTWLKTNL